MALAANRIREDAARVPPGSLALLLSAAGRQTRAAFFNGTSLAVDHTSYLAQHSVVYNAVPSHPNSAMAIGDGRLAALLWCPPSGLTLRIVYTDPSFSPSPAQPAIANAFGCTLLLRSDPSPLAHAAKFRQRLSLLTATVDLESESAGGSLQMEAWVAAEHNVLVIRYTDVVVRSHSRTVHLVTDETSKPFCVGEHIGLVESRGDCRMALVCALQGHGEPGWANPRTPSIAVPSVRGTTFTLLIAGAVTASHGDPVAHARAKIASVLDEGLDEANRRHRLRWRTNWDSSLLHLAASDTLAGYLEHLWYLYQYHAQACGMHLSTDVARGLAWRHAAHETAAKPPGSDLDTASLCIPLFAAARDEAVAPWLDRTAAQLCRRASEPSTFQATGEASAAEARLEHAATLLLPLWQRWLYSQDINWLRYRLYPAMRSLAEEWRARLSSLQAPASLTPLSPTHLRESGLTAETLARLRWLFRRAAEAGSILQEDIKEAERWSQLASVLEQLPMTPLDVYPFQWLGGDPSPIIAQYEQARFSPSRMEKGVAYPGPAVAARLALKDALVWALEETVHACQTFPQGLYSSTADSAERDAPRIGPGAELAAAIQEMCLQQQGDLLVAAPSLPTEWDAAFSLRAHPGIRVMGQTYGGETLWIALTPERDTTIKLRNPWNGEARVLVGRREILRTTDDVMSFAAQREQTYIIDRREWPLSRMLRVRLTARPRQGAHVHGYRQIGLD